MKVLFIAGSDRSGSTLLDLVLGSVDGLTAVGELSNIWGRGILEGRLCGCGAPVLACEVWSDVLSSVFGRAPGSDDARAIMSVRSRYLRVRHTREILRREPPQLGSYLDVLSRLYGAIARRTGARVIVDSSKDPSDAAALVLTPGVDVYVVHLVRDPRAVAYSLGHRAKVQPDAPQGARMARRGVARSTLDWAAWNLGSELVARTIPRRSIHLRYEDFTRSPQETTAQLLRFVGSAGATPFAGGTDVLLGPNHTVSGNPSRFANGSVRVVPDDEWAGRQSRSERLVASGIAAPLMRRYGYRIVGLGTEDRGAA